MPRFVVRKVEKSAITEPPRGDVVYREIGDGLGYEVIDADTGERVDVYYTEKDADERAMQLNA